MDKNTYVFYSRILCNLTFRLFKGKLIQKKLTRHQITNSHTQPHIKNRTMSAVTQAAEYDPDTSGVDGFLIDLDGTMYQPGGLLNGASDFYRK